MSIENRDTVLIIYTAPSGQLSGRVVDHDGEEVGRIAGCASAEEVEGAAIDAGFDFTIVRNTVTCDDI